MMSSKDYLVLQKKKTPHTWNHWVCIVVMADIQMEPGFHLENCPRGGGGGGGMMVKDVTRFHKRHLGVGVYLDVCVCVQGFIQDFEFERGILQSLVLMWRGCIAHNNQEGLGVCSPRIKKK